MNKKLALLLLVPLLTPLFLAVPVVRAQPQPFLMELTASCFNDRGPATYASVRVQTHTVQITCPAGSLGELYKSACFVTTTAQTKVFAEVKVGPTVEATNGRWTPGSWDGNGLNGPYGGAFWMLEDCTE